MRQDKATTSDLVTDSNIGHILHLPTNYPPPIDAGTTVVTSTVEGFITDDCEGGGFHHGRNR